MKYSQENHGSMTIFEMLGASGGPVAHPDSDWRPNKLFLLVGKPGTILTKFHSSILRQKNITRFNITVNFVLTMEIFKTNQRLIRNGCNLFFSQWLFVNLHDIRRRSEAVFHYQL
jgi:hypothetical protein